MNVSKSDLQCLYNIINVDIKIKKLHIKGKVSKDVKRQSQWVWLSFRIKSVSQNQGKKIIGNNSHMGRGNILSTHGREVFFPLGLNLKRKISCGTYTLDLRSPFQYKFIADMEAFFSCLFLKINPEYKTKLIRFKYDSVESVFRVVSVKVVSE